jgi:hypothetical protein
LVLLGSSRFCKFSSFASSCHLTCTLLDSEPEFEHIRRQGGRGGRNGGWPQKRDFLTHRARADATTGSWSSWLGRAAVMGTKVHPERPGQVVLLPPTRQSWLLTSSTQANASQANCARGRRTSLERLQPEHCASASTDEHATHRSHALQISGADKTRASRKSLDVVSSLPCCSLV